MPRPPLSLDVPAARRDPESGYTLHGRRFDDPYLWLEQIEDPEAQAWLEAQEAAARRLLRGVPGRDWLRAAVAGAARYARRSRPIRTGPHGREFIWQAEPGDDKQKLLIRRSADAPLETLIDPNRWPADEALVFATPSPDGALVAFGRAVGSTHDARVQVLDVETGRLLPDRPRGSDHASLAWLPDSSGFFYAACPAPGEVPPGGEAHWNAIYEHRIGADAPARRVFGDDQHKEYWCSVKVSECGRFAVLTKWDFVHANAVFLLRLADRALLPVAPALRAITRVQLIGDTLLIHTDLDAPRGRACVAPLAEPTAWRTLIPEDPADTLQTVRGVAGRLYAVYARAASHRVRIYAEDGSYLRDLALPGLGSVNRNNGGDTIEGIGGSWAGDEVWVDFESYVQPPSLYRYDYAADRLTPFHVPDAGLDPADYLTEQVRYESGDGTPVSMFVVRHNNLPRDGRTPVRLTGYGGFNIPLQPRFAAVTAAWLKLGGALAVAHVRGGGEYGRAWHEAAIKTRRQNAFDDYIAAARWLAAAGYTTPARLVSRGNSNGGLLVAVAAMQAPEVFGAVFCRAPTLDMLRFPRFSHLGAATVEYGSPEDPVEGAYLAGYSPYHAVRPGRPYPAMLFAPALNDRVAPPSDPLKMVARLQAEAPAGGPYLLLPLRSSGHAGATTLTALVEQDVDELCFCCWALGVAVPEPGAGE
ncbi:MAG TPA: prolyl oligopeptidase family serine peptidase [Roseiflexaceae bacterium]|nr:prolyl oligopeptidase family serine peptidase [Roseiflexaceae bacterium]